MLYMKVVESKLSSHHKGKHFLISLLLHLFVTFAQRNIKLEISLWFCISLQPHGRQPARLFCPWNSPGENTGVNCHYILQR